MNRFQISLLAVSIGVVSLPASLSIAATVNDVATFQVDQRGDPKEDWSLRRMQFYPAPIQSTGFWARGGDTLVVNYSNSGNPPEKILKSGFKILQKARILKRLLFRKYRFC